MKDTYKHTEAELKRFDNHRCLSQSEERKFTWRYGKDIYVIVSAPSLSCVYIHLFSSYWDRKKRVLKTTRQKWKHFEEMFVRTLHSHQLNSSSRLQTIICRKFCKHSQFFFWINCLWNCTWALQWLYLSRSLSKLCNYVKPPCLA